MNAAEFRKLPKVVERYLSRFDKIDIFMFFKILRNLSASG